jgi:L-iditol 2-dehydrogenase
MKQTESAPARATALSDASDAVGLLALALSACLKADVRPGSNVLITGAGPIGLLALQVARSFGAAHVLVVDVDPHRLRLAVEFGADDILETAAFVHDIGIDPDVHIDCSGDVRTTRGGISWLAPHGISVIIGTGADPRLDVPVSWILEKDIVVTGVSRAADCRSRALELLASGSIRAEPLGSRQIAAVGGPSTR